MFIGDAVWITDMS